MTHHSLHLLLPDSAPYQDEFYLESFVGNFVRPLYSRLAFFWFSRYGSPGKGEVKFRFSVENYESVRVEIETLISKFKHGADGCGSYDYVSDLAGERFLAPERKASGQTQRGLLAYQFLTASARLFIDCLAPNGQGWKHEEETKTKYNRRTPLEQYHHLFCNMTNVPVWATLLQRGNALQVVSDFQSRGISDPTIQMTLFPIQH